MGIDTSAVLIYGLSSKELCAGNAALAEEIERDGHYDVLSEDGRCKLEYASPYYDSDSCDRIWGVVLASTLDYTPAEFNLDDISGQKLRDAKVKFRQAVGLDGKLYLSPHVT